MTAESAQEALKKLHESFYFALNVKILVMDHLLLLYGPTYDDLQGTLFNNCVWRGPSQVDRAEASA